MPPPKFWAPPRPMTSHHNKVFQVSILQHYATHPRARVLVWRRTHPRHPHPRLEALTHLAGRVLTCDGQGGGGGGGPRPATHGHAFPCVPHHHQLTTDPRGPCPCKTLQNPLQMDPSFQRVHIFCRRRQAAPPLAKPRYCSHQRLPVAPTAVVMPPARCCHARPSAP